MRALVVIPADGPQTPGGIDAGARQQDAELGAVWSGVGEISLVHLQQEPRTMCLVCSCRSPRGIDAKNGGVRMESRGHTWAQWPGLTRAGVWTGRQVAREAGTAVPRVMSETEGRWGPPGLVASKVGEKCALFCHHIH